eukprot:Nk52_evm11s533 gene=Nk52_evmTU11s533
MPAGVFFRLVYKDGTSTVTSVSVTDFQAQADNINMEELRSIDVIFPDGLVMFDKLQFEGSGMVVPLGYHLVNNPEGDKNEEKLPPAVMTSVAPSGKHLTLRLYENPDLSGRSTSSAGSVKDMREVIARDVKLRKARGEVNQDKNEDLWTPRSVSLLWEEGVVVYMQPSFQVDTAPEAQKRYLLPGIYPDRVSMGLLEKEEDVNEGRVAYDAQLRSFLVPVGLEIQLFSGERFSGSRMVLVDSLEDVRSNEMARAGWGKDMNASSVIVGYTCAHRDPGVVGKCVYGFRPNQDSCKCMCLNGFAGEDCSMTFDAYERETRKLTVPDWMASYIPAQVKAQLEQLPEKKFNQYASLFFMFIAVCLACLKYRKNNGKIAKEVKTKKAMLKAMKAKGKTGTSNAQ